ncbi:hypothetical protein [Nocardia sp. NBC_00416]
MTRTPPQWAAHFHPSAGVPYPAVGAVTSGIPEFGDRGVVGGDSDWM